MNHREKFIQNILLKIYLICIVLTIDSCSKIIVPEYKIIEAHNESIRGFYLINNETQLLTSSLDGTIKIWNLENLRMEKLIADLPEYIESFTISQNEKFLLVSTPSYLYFYNLDSGKELFTYENKFKATSLAINNSFSWMAVTTGKDFNLITIIDLKTHKIKNTIKENVLPVHYLAFIEDNIILTGASDSKLFYYDIEKGKITEKFEIKNGIRVQDLQASSNGEYAFISGQLSDDGKDVAEISLSTGEIIKRFSGIGERIPTTSVSISDDGKYLVVTGREIIVYDILKEREMFKFYAPGFRSKKVKFTKSGKIISDGSLRENDANNLIYIWDVKPYLYSN